MVLFLWSPLLLLVTMVTCNRPEPAGVRIRITDKGLEMLKYETQKFVEEELSNISMPEMKGKEGRFQYTITDIKVMELNMTQAELLFQPELGLLFQVKDSSITLSFKRQILYWFFFDKGTINASAEGVDIQTALKFVRDDLGRLKISNISCDANIAKMRAEFSGTLGRVYDFLGSFITTGMRYLLNNQEPVMMFVLTVRSEVDYYVGIDYSLLSDPVFTSRGMDMHFRGMFYELANQNVSLENTAVAPMIQENDRMVYLALSEFFFDSGMFSYYKAGIFQMHIAHDRMSKDMLMMLRTTFFGTIMMLNPALMEAPLSLQLEVTAPPKTSIRTSGATVAVTAIVNVMVLPPGKPPVQLTSMTMEAKFNAKVSMKGKRLSVQLIPLQGPLKTMLQISMVPLINNWTKRGVQIPLADGMDFVKEVVEYHNGYIVIGANLHFSRGLRDMIEGSIRPGSEETL
uniref:Phospholipid transfer protein n=1 Tax=Gadus morhua TaxID=8049 RepID=A0A8C5AV59_GADMO